MKNLFLNKKLMQALDEAAVESYQKKPQELSYDLITKNVLKKINWSEKLNLKETTDYLYLKAKYAEKLSYYYDQIIKDVSMQGTVDLNSGEFTDFWGLLEKVGLDKYFTRFKCQVLDSNNLFSFLAIFKSKIKEEEFVTNFKLKSIEMMEYKKGLMNGTK